MRRLSFSTFRHVPLGPLICCGLVWLVAQTGLWQLLEWRTLDARTALRAHYQPPPEPHMAVILFEDSSNDSLPPPGWPVDRAFHGNLVELLSLDNPSVIAWDVILDASREGDGDAKMGLGVQAAAERGVHVVTASVTDPGEDVPAPGSEGPTQLLMRVEGDVSRLVGDEHALRPFPQLRAVSWYGFADTPPEEDGVRRRIPLVVRVGNAVYPSLGLQTLMRYLDVEADAVRVRLGDAIYLKTKTRGDLRIPIGADGRYWLNYRYDQDEYGIGDYPTYSYIGTLVEFSDYYVDRKAGARRPPSMEGKIVFIGQTVTGKADAGPTPRNRYAPLVLTHINLVDNVLRGDFVRQWPEWVLWLGLVAACYASLVWTMRRSVWFMGAFVLLGMAAYVEMACWVWIKWSLWLPLLWPLSGFAIASFLAIAQRVLKEQRAKQEIKGMFGTYVSPQLVDRLIKSGKPPQLGGHEEEITAYFSDIQSFSTFSELLTPDRLVGLMNEYLTACTDIVLEEGGSLDKYIGDAVVAMFGAPIPLPDHAYKACVAAQRVQLRLGELRAKWRSEGDRWPRIVQDMQSRIGLNSGRCIVGNMGSRTRFNYTMMGDDVNLGARMESGAKSWGVYTMCTEATRLACEQHGGDRVIFRPLGRIVVKGRKQAVPIFEIVGLKESVTADTLECLGLFSQGLACYYERDWNGALASFLRSAKLEPNISGQVPGVLNNPSLVYLGIVERYKNEPPPANWDGVYVMKEK